MRIFLTAFLLIALQSSTALGQIETFPSEEQHCRRALLDHYRSIASTVLSLEKTKKKETANKLKKKLRELRIKKELSPQKPIPGYYIQVFQKTGKDKALVEVCVVNKQQREWTTTKHLVYLQSESLRDYVDGQVVDQETTPWISKTEESYSYRSNSGLRTVERYVEHDGRLDAKKVKELGTGRFAPNKTVVSKLRKVKLMPTIKEFGEWLEKYHPVPADDK